MKRVWWWAMLGTSAALAACNAVFGIPERSEELQGPDGGITESGAPDARVDIAEAGSDAGSTTPSCAGQPNGNVCGTGFSELGNTSILRDGVASEYCSLPASTFVLKDAAKVEYFVDAGIPHDETARFFVATTSEGVGIHVHVDDPVILVTDTVNPEDGDSVAVYLGAGADAGANPFKVVVSPPANGKPMKWVTLSHGTNVDLGIEPPAARLVDGGYEVELYVAKTAFKAPVFQPNAPIRFDLAVNVKDSPSTKLAEMRSFYAAVATLGATAALDDCPTRNPDCDWRAWCATHF